MEGQRGVIPNWAEEIGDLLEVVENSNYTNWHKYQEYNKKNLERTSSRGDAQRSWGHTVKE